MNIADFYQLVIKPGFACLPEDLNTREARVQVAATAGAETNWSARMQVPSGPGHGYFQCEGGPKSGLAGVIADPVAKNLLGEICAKFDITCSLNSVYQAITYHDIVAVAVARFIYLMDANALPAIGNSTGSMDYYLHNWRPSKPITPDRWHSVYALTLTNIP
jgi:hypothetical protein